MPREGEYVGCLGLALLVASLVACCFLSIAGGRWLLEDDWKLLDKKGPCERENRVETFQVKSELVRVRRIQSRAGGRALRFPF